MAERLVFKRLWEPILDQGIPNTHFFNGRILTAGDLKTEQNANLRQHQQLGQAAGAGVVRGLEVTLVSDGSDGTAPVVYVTSGLALNCSGQAIALPVDVQVAFERQSKAVVVEVTSFKECTPRKKADSPMNPGIYVLVAFPTSGYQERAPKTGLYDSGKVVGCGARYETEGVKFRLEELQISDLTGVSQDTRDALTELANKSDAASVSKLRNWLAHVCFGTEELGGFVQDPFARIAGQPSSSSAYLKYGALDVLRDAGDLTCADVPLALLHWPKGGVQFLDMWSVRRRPIPRPRSSTWPLPLSERRLAEAEAAFSQFQCQTEWLIQSIANQSKLASMKATDCFRYLPSCGILPITADFVKKYQAEGKAAQAFSGKEKGLDPMKFLEGLTCRDPVFVEGARFDSLVHESLHYPPVDVNSKEMIWLYLVRENVELSEQARPLQPYLIFTIGHMPFHGEARYDLSRWDYSNYS